MPITRSIQVGNPTIIDGDRTKEEWSGLHAGTLRQKCAEYGLSQSGKKNVMINKLMAHFNQPNSAGENEQSNGENSEQ